MSFFFFFCGSFFLESVTLLTHLHTIASQRAQTAKRVVMAGLSIFRIVFAIVYWYLWTVAVPRWRGYRLEEEVDVLEDGTSITKLIKVKDD